MDFDNIDILFDIFLEREKKIEKQMFYFIKAINLIMNNIIKNEIAKEIEILLKPKIIELIKFFGEKIQYLIYDYKGTNILHIICDIPIMDKEIETKILDFMDRVNKNLLKNEFEKLLNQQDIQRETIVFKLIKNQHEKYYDIFDLSVRNYNGDTILHLLMSIKIFNRNIFYLTQKVINYNKYFIISKNNYEITPFHLACRNGCNDSIFLMTSYFSLDYIDSISNNGKTIHFASISNCISTLRLLMEMYKLDINMVFHKNIEAKVVSNKKGLRLPNNSTPIFCAGYFNCVNTFHYLLSLGANPLIKDDNDNDAIDIALIKGDKEMIDFIINTQTFVNSDGKYLLSLVKNEHGIKALKQHLFNLGFHNINIINSYQQNLLMIAIQNNNYKALEVLLKFNINFENVDIDGQNILHYCINSNSITSCYIILNYLFEFGKFDIIYNLIYNTNNDGENSIFTSAKYGRDEIIYYILLYINILNFPKKLTNNYAGLSPIHIAIINNHNSVALLIQKYFNLSDDYIINNISGEYKLKIESFFSSNVIELKLNKKIYKILQSIKSKSNINISDYIDKYKQQSEIVDLLLEDTFGIKYIENMIEIFPNILTEETYLTFQNILSVNLLLKLSDKTIFNDVKEFFDILSKIKSEPNIKQTIYWKLLNLFTIYIIPRESQKLNFINQVITQLFSNNVLINLNINHPLLFWIESVIISGSESESLISVNELLTNFINIMTKEEQYLNNLIFVRVPMKTFQFISFLNRIISKIQKEYAIIQLKYLNYIPPLIEKDINDLLSKCPIIHQDIYNKNPLYSFKKKILLKKSIHPQLLESCLLISDSIIDSVQISYSFKELIQNFCLFAYERYSKNELLSSFLINVCTISENLANKYGEDSIKNLLNIIKTIINKSKNNNLSILIEILQQLILLKTDKQLKKFCDYLLKNSLINVLKNIWKKFIRVT